MAAHEVRNKIYERDGVKYSLVVEEEERAYWGTWTCLPCNEKGQSSKMCSTIREAMDMAEGNTSFHHLAVHERRKET